MRKFLILIWCMLPVLLGAWHYGPGQEQLKLDEAALLLKQAQAATDREDFASAVLHYEDAINAVPAKRTHELQRLRLEKAKAQMQAKQLPTANGDLKTLLAELVEDKNADPKLREETRAALANSQYYMTWLMRLEGVSRDEWEPEIEAARQHYRLLAESSEKDGETKQTEKHKQDLESVIRLARMDLKDLQGLPLPSQ